MKRDPKPNRTLQEAIDQKFHAKHDEDRMALLLWIVLCLVLLVLNGAILEALAPLLFAPIP